MSEQYNHAEAFCLMRYVSMDGLRAGDGSIVEYIWNSRDGVTPMFIRSRDGAVDMAHTDLGGMDRRPQHKPQVGDRIFVSLTMEQATELAKTRADSEEECRKLAEYYYGDGTNPHLITVK